MKYLRIHDLLFIILLIAYILIEIIFIGIVATIYVIWNFELPKTLWSDFHEEENTVIYMEGSKEMEIKTERHIDKNPWETFKRRLDWWNSLKE